MRNAFQDDDNKTAMMDLGLGNAFPIVREVYKNLQKLTYVAEHLGELRPKDIELIENTANRTLDWRYLNQDGTKSDWQVLVPLEDITGQSPELRVNAQSMLQWKYTNEPDSQWRNIFDMSGYVTQVAQNTQDIANLYTKVADAVNKEYALNAARYGISPAKSKEDNKVSFDRWFADLKLTKRRGFIPAGVYKSDPLVWDFAGMGDSSITIVGDGMHNSTIDFSESGGGILITNTDSNRPDSFYSSFSDFSIRGNTPDILFQLGDLNNTVPINAFEFRNIWVGNNYVGGNPIVAQLNWVLATIFSNVVFAGNHSGKALQLRAVAFCTWIGGSATWGDIGIDIPPAGFGTVAGNRFLDMDFEENVTGHVSITNPNAHDNVWSGGTWVYVPGTQFCVDATAGQRNKFESMFCNTGSTPASYTNFCKRTVGIDFQGLGVLNNNTPGNVGFTAFMQNEFSMPAGVWTKIPFDRVQFSKNADYASGQLIVDKPGLHRFTAKLSVYATNASLATHRVGFYVNGFLASQSTYNVAAGTNTITISDNSLLALSPGDRVEVWANLGASSGNPIVQGGSGVSTFTGQYEV